MKTLKLNKGIKEKLVKLIVTMPDNFTIILNKETFTEFELEKDIALANEIISHIEQYKERLLSGFTVIGG